MGGRAAAPASRDIFSDVFGDIFGGGGSAVRSQRGSDLRYTLELELEKAVRGDSVEIRVPVLAACEECEGSGAQEGHQPDSRARTAAARARSACRKVSFRCSRRVRAVAAPVR